MLYLLSEEGAVRIPEVVAGNEQQQQQKIIFDPIPRVDGIEPSGDPLLELVEGQCDTDLLGVIPRPPARRRRSGLLPNVTVGRDTDR